MGAAPLFAAAPVRSASFSFSNFRTIDITLRVMPTTAAANTWSVITTIFNTPRAPNAHEQLFATSEILPEDLVRVPPPGPLLPDGKNAHPRDGKGRRRRAADSRLLSRRRHGLGFWCFAFPSDPVDHPRDSRPGWFRL